MILKKPPLIANMLFSTIFLHHLVFMWFLALQLIALQFAELKSVG